MTAPFSNPTEALIGNGERVYRGARDLLEWAARFYDSDAGLLGPVPQDVCQLLDTKQEHSSFRRWAATTRMSGGDSES